MKYVIHSKSERGFWSNSLGWVFNIKDATIFDSSYPKLWKKPTVLTAGNDGEWIVVEYDENFH